MSYAPSSSGGSFCSEATGLQPRALSQRIGEEVAMRARLFRLAVAVASLATVVVLFGAPIKWFIG